MNNKPDPELDLPGLFGRKNPEKERDPNPFEWPDDDQPDQQRNRRDTGLDGEPELPDRQERPSA